jgi:hypothetical protein
MRRIPSARLARLGRRQFLGLTAGAAVLLPFVPVLEREAAAVGTPCKRLFVFHTPNGSILRNWRVPGMTHGDALPETLSEILQPLSAYRDRMIVLDGIDNLPTAYAALGELFMAGKGHQASGSIWTQWAPEAAEGQALCDNDTPCAWPAGPSFDQFVADRIGHETPFASINPGVRVASSERLRNYFYNASGQPIVREISPRTMFDSLFADLQLDPDEKARLRAEKKSVIDSVSAELTALDAKLGASDRRRIEAHLEGIRALEQAIDGLDAVCEIPPQPGDDLDVYDNDSLPTILDLQIEIAVNALACDLTRVVALQWGAEGAFSVATWLGHDEGDHTISHWEAHGSEELSIQWMTDLNRWYAEKVALVTQRLIDHNVLDETLLVWSHTMCEGMQHNARNVPMVLLQGEGYFETGRYLKYGDFPDVLPLGQVESNEDYGGESMNRFITSLCHAMGFADVDSFGDPQFGTGPLPGL